MRRKSTRLQDKSAEFARKTQIFQSHLIDQVINAGRYTDLFPAFGWGKQSARLSAVVAIIGQKPEPTFI